MKTVNFHSTLILLFVMSLLVGFSPASAHEPSLESAANAELKSLPDSSEAFLARIMLIRRAQKSIDVSYYIFKRDKAGYAFLYEIRQALKRGVKVRLLVDSLGSLSYTHKEFISLFEVTREHPEQLQILTINPPAHFAKFLSRLSKIFEGKWVIHPIEGWLKINSRSHDKILLIDSGTENMMAIVGGRNIGNNNFEIDAENEPSNHDYDIIVKPPAGTVGSQLDQTLSDYFNVLYHQEDNRTLSSRLFRIFSIDTGREFQKMDEASDNLLNDLLLAKFTAMQREHFLDRGFESASMNFVTDIQNLIGEHVPVPSADGDTTKKLSGLNNSVEERFRNATRSIEVSTPYPIFRKKEIKDLRQWLLANPKATFTLYGNSYGTSDVATAQAYFDQYVGPALMKLKKDARIGERLKLYTYFGKVVPNDGWLHRLTGLGSKTKPGGGLMHAKIIVIDGKDALVSTSNLDPRSRTLNSEMGFWIASDHQLEELGAYFKDLRSVSYEWGSPEWTQHRQTATGLETGLMQKSLYKFIRLLHLEPLL